MKEGKQMAAQAEFEEFVDLVLDGYTELAAVMDEAALKGQSMGGINGGMVDGTGKSKAWDTYWRICGVCHPSARPTYIMHLDTLNEDFKVLLQVYYFLRSAKIVAL